jgi:hypothetical protein
VFCSSVTWAKAGAAASVTMATSEERKIIAVDLSGTCLRATRGDAPGDEANEWKRPGSCPGNG